MTTIHLYSTALVSRPGTNWECEGEPIETSEIRFLESLGVFEIICH